MGVKCQQAGKVGNDCETNQHVVGFGLFIRLDSNKTNTEYRQPYPLNWLTLVFFMAFFLHIGMFLGMFVIPTVNHKYGGNPYRQPLPDFEVNANFIYHDLRNLSPSSLSSMTCMHYIFVLPSSVRCVL